MNLSDFDYSYPSERVAQHPSDTRGMSRLLVADRRTAEIHHTTFDRIIDFFQAGDVIVVNQTKVIPARLFGQKKTGGRVEIFLLEKLDKNRWKSLAFPLKRIKINMEIFFGTHNRACVESVDEKGFVILIFDRTINFQAFLNLHGHIPLPPYIRRDFEEDDRERYQTIFSKNEGAVAAPTAGLHWTESLCDQVLARNISIVPITLHVGYGTFEPIRVSNIAEHKMHAEYIEISEHAAQVINEAKRVIAIGTTVVRALESCVVDHHIRPYSGMTNLFITPGYDFKKVDILQTNFHQPKSSLLVLVSSFAGREFIFKCYREAINQKYQLFSYGDTMLIL